MEEHKSLRVLIAENHRDLSEVMSQLIDTEPDMRCVGQVSDAADVLPKARESAAATAHKLSGSLGMFGFPEGTAAAREIEVMLEAESAINTDHFTALTKKLRAALEL